MVDKFKYPNGDIYEGEAYNKKVSNVDMKLKYQNKIQRFARTSKIL